MDLPIELMRVLKRGRFLKVLEEKLFTKSVFNCAALKADSKWPFKQPQRTKRSYVNDPMIETSLAWPLYVNIFLRPFFSPTLRFFAGVKNSRIVTHHMCVAYTIMEQLDFKLCVVILKYATCTHLNVQKTHTNSFQEENPPSQILLQPL